MAKHKLHRANLTAKGWTDEEIAHAEEVLEHAEEKKHPGIAKLDQFVYWFLLLFTIIGVALFAAFVIPVLLILPASMVYIVLLIISVCLGALFTIVIQDIHWLSNRHHGFALAVLPLIAMLVFLFVPVFTRDVVHVQMHQNSWIMGLVFALGLIAPYVFHLLTEHKQRSK